MVIIQHRPKRKASSGRYKAARKKRLYERGSRATLTGLGERKLRMVRTKGGSRKVRLQATNLANVYDAKAKKHKVVKIRTIVSTPANINLARRNIMTRGTIIDTEAGQARVTSRPGQDGAVNAILL